MQAGVVILTSHACHQKKAPSAALPERFHDWQGLGWQRDWQGTGRGPARDWQGIGRRLAGGRQGAGRGRPHEGEGTGSQNESEMSHLVIGI